MPKTTEEIYQELLARGNQYQQQADDLLSQYDNRPAFSYNAETDPLYQSLKNQYVHQGQRAMQDTMGQAAGLTGGYGNTYAQSVGNQAYNEYMTQLNAQIPGLAQQARAVYDDEGNRLLDRYSLALNAANNAYGQGRDALGDLRYSDELAYQRARDALSDQRYQDELTWNRQQSQQSDARSYATYLLQMGIMPSADQLTAAGMTPEEAQKIIHYYTQIQAGQNGKTGNYTYNPGNPQPQPQPDQDPNPNTQQNPPATTNDFWYNYYKGQLLEALEKPWTAQAATYWNNLLGATSENALYREGRENNVLTKEQFDELTDLMLSRLGAL